MSQPSQEEIDAAKEHNAAKRTTTKERDADRSIKNHHAVVYFDFQNVINLPRANKPSFINRHKLNVYNLTAH
jgi:hypothetical protein